MLALLLLLVKCPSGEGLPTFVELPISKAVKAASFLLRLCFLVATIYFFRFAIANLTASNS